VDPAPQPGRATTRSDRDGREIGLLVHDAALAAEPDLVRAVAADATITLENERLHAEVRSRVREVEASRARIVAAADAAREQLERDLIGGVAQRLATVALLLRLAGDRSRNDEHGALLDEADTELAGALADLRELARGIYPVLLTDAGLGPALTALADRAGTPIRLGQMSSRRLPTAIEQGCYAVATTVLARAAGAAVAELDLQVDGTSARLRIRVEGAAPGPMPGASDRVAALAGTLATTAEPDATTVTVTLPLADGSP
jgi:signal transduction histidine kinase